MKNRENTQQFSGSQNVIVSVRINCFEFFYKPGLCGYLKLPMVIVILAKAITRFLRLTMVYSSKSIFFSSKQNYISLLGSTFKNT